LPREEIVPLMRDASFLVFPSECYETFGLTIVEAFATGSPVVASGLGAARELVEHGRSGLHFRNADVADLVAQLEWAFTHESEMAEMGRRARAAFESKYTASVNYHQLLDIYEMAMKRKPAMR
jgi:glycosyltransferase involved in cell wall biosynthesis